MTEINYKDLEKYLSELPAGDRQDRFAPVYLIYGEEFLYKNILKRLVQVMVPADKHSLNYEPIDGATENISDALMRLNTYSMLSSTKVVALCDSRIFYSGRDDAKLLAKAKEAYAENDMGRAAQDVLKLLALANLSLEDLQGPNKTKTLKIDPQNAEDLAWLDKVIDYCQAESLAVPDAEDAAAVLQAAVEKGFPQGNRLIITTDTVDKRRALYKTIKQKGVVIECAIPKGDRRADKMAQEGALNEKMAEILDQHNKTMDPGAYLALCEMTGFDLRIFSNNLKKLIDYVGQRGQIGLDDVESVIERTKKDPIYELTNAVADRNIERALFSLNTLLSSDFHPLQLLAAVVNQMRRLLLAKGFVRSSEGADWDAGLSYAQFKTRVMPMIQAHDNNLLEQVQAWENELERRTGGAPQGSSSRRTAKKSDLPPDLWVAKNPKNPYPVYQLLLKSEKYKLQELIDAFDFLRLADLRLKSTRQRPKWILEETIIKICADRNIL